jgi:hypothetical protein
MLALFAVTAFLATQGPIELRLISLLPFSIGYKQFITLINYQED